MIGSLLYIIIITRLDIVFVILRLARFNYKLGEEYYKDINRVLAYLYNIRFLALSLGREDLFEAYSNALFVNNILDRKSF